MRRRSIVVALACLFIAVGSAAAFEEDEDYYKRMPGYIDFGEFGEFDTSDEAVEVLVKAPLLKLVSKVSEQDNPDLAQILAGVHLIKVNVFNIDSLKFVELSKRASEIEKKMRKEGWEAIVRAKEKGERAYVYMKYDEDEIAGIAVVALEEDGEAAFVNIVGNLDLEALSKLSGSFDIPELKVLKKESNREYRDEQEAGETGKEKKDVDE